MEIGFFLGALNRGGKEIFLLDLIKQCRQSGISVICIHRKKGELYNEYSSSGIELIELLPPRYFSFTYFIKLRRNIIKKNIKVAHCHQITDAAYVQLALIGLKIPIVISHHGRGLYDSIITRFIRKNTIKKAAANIFVSQEQRKSYIERLRINDANSYVIYNGLDFEKFDKYRFVSLRCEFQISERSMLLGCIGNFTEGRDPMTICRFLNLLNKNKIDFIFFFVGKKDKNNPMIYNECIEYCRLNNLIGKTLFLGTRNDIPNILHQLDAYIYSSSHDTFGISVIEAIAAGKPVFINDWETMLEITNQGKWANIYKSQNEIDLFEKFNHFLSNKSEYESLAKIYAENARSKYSIKNHLLQLTNIYNSLTTNHS